VKTNPESGGRLKHRIGAIGLVAVLGSVAAAGAFPAVAGAAPSGSVSLVAYSTP